MKMSITQLSEADRPREKFLTHGARALSKAELLAILIGSGNDEENAVQLMQRLVTDTGDRLANLERLTVQELCAYRGVGPAKAITILAACELMRRSNDEQHEVTRIRSAEDIYAFFRSKNGSCTVEECHVLLLNHDLRVIGSRLISRGGLTGTVVDIRMVLREALLANATHIALCHNHPSGSLRPSREDDSLTERVRKAAQTMDIRLVDHVIVTTDGFYSYQDQERI